MNRYVRTYLTSVGVPNEADCSDCPDRDGRAVRVLREDEREGKKWMATVSENGLGSSEFRLSGPDKPTPGHWHRRVEDVSHLEWLYLNARDAIRDRVDPQRSWLKHRKET